MSDGRIVHGMTGTKEYRAWAEIKRRCLTTTSKDYKRYGAKGITVDEDYIHSFQNFYDEVGPAPSPEHTIDRIDGRKGYVKGNMRWATIQDQAYNRRTSYIVTIDGVEYEGFGDAGRKLGVTSTTIQRRCKGFYDKRWDHWTPPLKGYSYELRYK